jgi:hypothetical protein
MYEVARGSWLVAAIYMGDSPRAHVSVNDTQRRVAQQGERVICTSVRWLASRTTDTWR